MLNRTKVKVKSAAIANPTANSAQSTDRKAELSPQKISSGLITNHIHPTITINLIFCVTLVSET